MARLRDLRARLRDGVFRLLLLAYPADFRDRAGADMRDVFIDLLAGERGSLGIACLWLRTARDLAIGGVAERLARRRRHQEPGGHRRKGDLLMHVMLSDLKYAARTLLKQPGFAATTVFVLGLGIAGTSGVFNIFNGLFLGSLPFEDPDRLVNVDETAPQWNLEFVSVNYTDFVAWREGNETFEAIAVFDSDSVNMSLEGEPLRVEALQVSHDIFEVLGITPSPGRAFTAEEDRPGAPAVVLLGHALWRERFGADPGVLGRRLNLDGEPHDVIGVLPPQAEFFDGDLWTPLRTDTTENPGSWWLSGIGRMRPGVALEEARADLERVHRGLVDVRPVNEVTTPVVLPVLDRLLGDVRIGTMALLGGVSVVLLIACANIAGLMLARSTTRSREVGIRMALGAGRARIMQQLLTESLLLAGLGAVLGAALGYAGVRAALAVAPDVVPRWVSFEMDLRFFLFTAAVTAGAALLFGFAPALRAARTDPKPALHASSPAGNGRRWGLDALVVCEIALALMLLVGAGLFMTAYQRLQRVDPGFRPESVLAYRISLPEASHGEEEQQRAFFTSHVEQVAALPGVVAAGAASAEPLGSHTGYFFEAEGAEPRGEDEPTPVTLVRWVTRDYFEAIGITLLAGRSFEATDQAADAPGVAVVNEAFARYYWPDAEAVGKRFSSGGDEPNWITVVGVARNVKHYGLDEEMRPGIYLSFERNPRSAMTIVARTALAPRALVPQVRDLIRQADPTLPVFGVTTMQEKIDESLWPRRAASWTLAIFAGVALALAISGIYGVISYAVGRRTQEIGIRMALGARGTQVLGEVLRRGGTLILLGVILGLAGAALLARLVSGLLFAVSATDPWIYGAVTLLLAGVALLANLVPARRAAGTDPMTALRDS